MEDGKEDIPDIRLSLSALRDGSVALVAVLYILGLRCGLFGLGCLTLDA